MKNQAFVVVVLVLAGCAGVPRVPDKVLDAQAAKLDPAASAQRCREQEAGRERHRPPHLGAR